MSENAKKAAAGATSHGALQWLIIITFNYYIPLTVRGSDSMMEPVCRAFPHTLHKHTDINSIPTSNGLGKQLVELGVGFQESKHSTSELKQDRGHSESNKEGEKVLHWTCDCTPNPCTIQLWIQKFKNVRLQLLLAILYWLKFWKL